MQSYANGSLTEVRWIECSLNSFQIFLFFFRWRKNLITRELCWKAKNGNTINWWETLILKKKERLSLSETGELLQSYSCFCMVWIFFNVLLNRLQSVSWPVSAPHTAWEENRPWHTNKKAKREGSRSETIEEAWAAAKGCHRCSLSPANHIRKSERSGDRCI